MDRTTRTATLGLRTTPEVKDLLVELAELISVEVGTKITQSQALEVAIKEAVVRRRKA